MPSFKTLDQADVAGKRVLVRADLNVPMKDGRVTDATRIERLVPTLKDLMAKNAKVVVLSHFDRPKGKRVPEMSLKPIAPVLSKAIGAAVVFADDCIGLEAKKVVDGLAPGGVALLENLRYHNGEEANDLAFIKDLAALDCSTPPRVASEWSRLLFLRRYTGRVARWRLKFLAALARWKSRAMRRHVERSVARLEPNFHASA